MNELPIEPPPVELPDEPPGEHPGTDAYFDTNLDGLGLGNTYKNLGTDLGNGLGIAAPFKLNDRLGSEFGAGSIGSDIDENFGIALYDDLGINTVLDLTINHCADIGLGNEYSQVLVKVYIQTTI